MEGTAGKHRWQQILYILAPFFLLLACLVFINFVPGQGAAGPTTTPQMPAQGARGGTAVADGSRPTTPLTSPTTTPIPATATPLPPATLPPDAAINLLGPPDGSSFRRLDTISFYAEWPLALVEPQQLAAYARFPDQPPILLGTLDAPNIGRNYRWQMNLGEMVDTAASLEWWIQLQTSSDPTPLLTSPTREITLLP